MKYSEIFEDAWDQTYLKGSLQTRGLDPLEKEINKQRQNPEHQYVGSGANAYVSKSTSPHEMDNVQRTSSNTDGTVGFYNWLIDNPEEAANPYFPRVLSLNTNSTTTASAKIERLVSVTSPRVLSTAMMVATAEYMFNEPVPGFEDVKATDDLPQDELHEYIATIAEILDRIVANRRVAITIKDPQLKAALSDLQYIARSEHYNVDIHDENIMWRITGNRPHLVITDPFT